MHRSVQNVGPIIQVMYSTRTLKSLRLDFLSPIRRLWSQTKNMLVQHLLTGIQTWCSAYKQTGLLYGIYIYIQWSSTCG
jgi:hypothetical protein